MLDARESALLAKINALCGDGFKIAEEGELLSAFPAAQGVDGAALARLLRGLEEARYIEIKYAEEGVYCIRSLPEGKRYPLRVREERIECAKKRTGALFASAIGAFFGALLGGFLVLLLLR